MNVTVGDASLYVEEHGAGAPLVMLHGIGMSSVRVWDRVLPGLAERYRVIAYDLRGLGRSTDPARTQNVWRHASDLVALMDLLDLEDAHLLGFSYGGFVVQQVGLEHPRRARSLILVGTSAGLEPHLFPRYHQRAELIEREGMAAYVDKGMRSTFTPRFLATRPDLAAWYREEFIASDPSVYIAVMLSMPGVDFRTRLGAIRCPTLILGGADDESPIRGPEPLGAARELQRLIPASEMVGVPDAAHYVPLEQPKAFVSAVSEFIDGVEAGRAGNSGA